MENYKVWKKDIYDALLKSGEELLPLFDEDGFPVTRTVIEIEQAIENAPSAESIYGVCWLYGSDELGEYIMCSRCRHKIHLRKLQESDYVRFCPFCGAECGKAEKKNED